MKKLIYSMIGIGTLCFIALSHLVWAATTPPPAVPPLASLYQAAVPVASQSIADKEAAIPKAFNQVLLKVSKNSQILNNPKVAQAAANAGSFVEEYSYSQPVSADGVTPSAYVLKITFDKDAIDKLLQSIVPASAEVLTHIHFKVIGVTQQDDLQVVMNYLKGINPVTDVEIEDVAGPDVTFTLTLKGTQEALVELLASRTKLEAVPGATGDLLTYQWKP